MGRNLWWNAINGKPVSCLIGRGIPARQADERRPQPPVRGTTLSALQNPARKLRWRKKTNVIQLLEF